MAKVFIDPGHNFSGADTGAAGFGLKEQDVSVLIAQRLRPMLEKNGFSVKMSREKITDVVASGLSASLSGRAQAANDWGADIFISIHCNAANTKAYGCETYCVSTAGSAGKLARFVQNHMPDETERYDRGVKTANFAVLTRTSMPAILVETAFIDNYDDNKFLASSSGREKCAAAICKGVCEYFGVEYNSESEEELMSKEYDELKAKNDSQDKIINEIGVDIQSNKNDIDGIKNSLKRYDYVDENMPAWAVPTITKLVTKGFLKGDENGKLNLTEDQLRLYTVNDRAGLYGE